MSERDGNMELYSRKTKNNGSNKHSYERLTSDHSLQVSRENQRSASLYLAYYTILYFANCPLTHFCSITANVSDWVAVSRTGQYRPRMGASSLLQPMCPTSSPGMAGLQSIARLKVRAMNIHCHTLQCSLTILLLPETLRYRAERCPWGL